MDASGNAVPDVALALMVKEDLEWDSVWLGETDERGRAQVDPIDESSIDLAAPLVLAPSHVRSTPMQVEFTLASIPTEPVSFVVGPTGSVELVIVDSEGQPIEVQAEVRLRAETKEGARESIPMLEGISQDVKTATGRHSFAPMGLGLQFVASAYARAHEFEPITFDGPTGAGERTRATVKVVRALPRVRGRLLDASGAESSDFSVSGRFPVEYLSGSKGSLEFKGRVESDGTFQAYLFQLEAPVRSGTGAVELELVRAGSSVGHASATVPVVVEVRDPLPRDEYDLGAIAFESMDLIASGRVVDARGEPVEGADIGIRLPGTVRWGRAGLETAEDGSFELRGEPFASSFDLRAQHGAYAPSDAVIWAGRAQGLVLQLRDVGSLRGRLLLPDNARLDAFLLMLRRTDGPEGTRVHGYEYDDSGEFLLRHAAPGRYGVQVLFEGRTLIDATDIEVRPSETTSAGPFDLRKLVHVIAVEVRDERGEPIEGASVWAADVEDGKWRETGPDGKTFLESLDPSPRLVVYAQNYRAVRIQSNGSATLVTLPPGIPLSVHLSEQVPLPAMPIALELSFRRTDGSPAESELPRTIARIGAAGPATLSFPSGGTYECKVIVIDTRDELGSRIELEYDLAPIVVAPDSAPVTIDIPRNLVLDAIARLRDE